MIRGIAEQIVNRLLTEQGSLLTSAIMAVIGALRVNPDKYNIIFDNTKYDDNTNLPEQPLSYLLADLTGSSVTSLLFRM